MKKKMTKDNGWEGLVNHNFSSLSHLLAGFEAIEKKSSKPNIIELCPNCESSNIGFKYEIQYGHGDSGYSNARIQCDTCSLSIGNKSDWDRPSNKEEFKLWENWNKMVNNLKKIKK